MNYLVLRSKQLLEAIHVRVVGVWEHDYLQADNSLDSVGIVAMPL